MVSILTIQLGLSSHSIFEFERPDIKFWTIWWVLPRDTKFLNVFLIDNVKLQINPTSYFSHIERDINVESLL